MNLLGWNVLPDNCSVEFVFEEGPTWLKALALTPFFDRFAYPTAVKRGLGILWCTALSEVEIQTLESLGWKVQRRDKNIEEKFFEGSFAPLTSNSKHQHFRSISLTRWGRQMAMRKFVHKTNGTYSNLQNGTLPVEL